MTIENAISKLVCFKGKLGGILPNGLSDTLERTRVAGDLEPILPANMRVPGKPLHGMLDEPGGIGYKRLISSAMLQKPRTKRRIAL